MKLHGMMWIYMELVLVCKKVAVLAFAHRSGYHCYYFEYYFSVVDFVYNNNCVYCDSYIFHYSTVYVLLFYLETVPPRVQPQKL